MEGIRARSEMTPTIKRMHLLTAIFYASASEQSRRLLSGDCQIEGFKMRQFARALLFVTLATCFGTAQSRFDLLTRFLQEYIGTPDSEARNTEYAVAFSDLSDSGTDEAIVYLSSDGWCGTGGCTMLILAPEGTSYKVISKIPAVRLPIWVFPQKTHGWHDIGVVGRKSGTEPLYTAILSFDGKRYPYVSEGDELHGKVEGKVVMPATAKSRPLYH